jgi:hypothetical protein
MADLIPFRHQIVHLLMERLHLLLQLRGLRKLVLTENVTYLYGNVKSFVHKSLTGFSDAFSLFGQVPYLELAWGSGKEWAGHRLVCCSQTLKQRLKLRLGRIHNLPHTGSLTFIEIQLFKQKWR